MLKHIVCWRIKEEAEGASKKENIIKMKKMLEALPYKISEIEDFEVGINFNASEAAYDISLYSAFNDEKALEAYQVHPAHVEVASFIKAITKERVVCDYHV
jgi:hypothetical protein